ncbi:helix-turn-helix domain-containing protein [Streptomyces sp. NPDC003710]
MSRPETPIDPSAGPVERFAYDLRQLRKAAGSPSYRKMSSAAHFSGTTLSQAARGKRHPSLAVTLAYVQACGGDPQEWRQRWLAVEHSAAARQEKLSSTEVTAASGASLESPQRGEARTQTIALAASAGAFGVILALAGAAVTLPPLRASLRGHIERAVHALAAASGR